MKKKRYTKAEAESFKKTLGITEEEFLENLQKSGKQVEIVVTTGGKNETSSKQR